jgi:hypothetical protein
MASYYLGPELTPQALDSQGGTSNYETGQSFTVGVGPITKEVTDFITVTRQVIANLEGGYYNPEDHSTGDSRYGLSGESMFGIDRKAGAPATAGPENSKAPQAAKDFWTKIGNAQKKGRWPYEYIPPDPLQTELTTLAANVMKPTYEAYKKNYFKNAELVKVIESDGRLLFNFIYASWNGPGWFKAFAEGLTDYYNTVAKDADSLLKWIVGRRIDPSGLKVTPKYTVKKGDDAWSLINQSGLKIKTLVGLT